MHYLYIGIGAIMGASARHFIFGIMEAKSLNFPYNTLLVNISGCILIGLVAELLSLKTQLPYNIRLFLITGILGSFTTFSTFALDAGLLIEKNEWLKSITYMLSSVVAGVMSYFLAVYMVRMLTASKI